MAKKIFILVSVFLFLTTGIVLASNNQISFIGKFSDNKIEVQAEVITQHKNTLSNSATIENQRALVEAYLKRAHYYKKTKEKDLYANDLRAALFYARVYNETNELMDLFDKASLELLRYENKLNYSTEALYQKAELMVVNGQLEAAAWTYYILGKRDYKASLSYEKLGDILVKLNYTKKSIEFYTLSVQNDSKNLVASSKLANAYELSGDTIQSNATWNTFLYAINPNYERKTELLESVEKHFSKKLKQSPKNPDNYIALAMVAQKNGRFDEANKLFQKAISFKADDLFINYLIGPLYFEQGKYYEAINVFDNLLELQPTDSEIRMFKAKSLLELKNKNGAIKELEYVMSIYPESNKAKISLFNIVKGDKSPGKIIEYLFPRYKNTAVDANAYYNFARMLQANGQSKDAATYYRIVIDLNPDNANAYLGLTQIYDSTDEVMKIYHMLKDSNAHTSGNKTVKSVYDSVAAKYNQKIISHADDLMRKTQYQSAINFYKQIEPQDFKTSLSIATCYQLLRDDINAVKYYAKALKFSPDNPKIYYYLGVIEYNKSNYTASKNHLKKSLLFDNNDEKTKNLLAHVEKVEGTNFLNIAYEYYEKGDYDNAISSLNKVISNEPNNAEAYYYRAVINDALKKYSNAIADFTKTQKIDPNFEDIDYYLGKTFDKMGLTKNAMQAYDKYLNTNPQDTDFIIHAQKRLNELGGLIN